MSNAVAVGKRLGVQPTLARRVAAAGRNGKRLVTGDAENANRVVGKFDPMETLRAFRGGAKAGVMGLKPKAILPSSRLGSLSPSGTKALDAGEKTGAFARTNRKPLMIGGAAGLGAAGAYSSLSKAAPGTNGLGMLVPAMRGQARNSLVPQSSATATGQQKGSKLAAFGGTKPATAGMSGASAPSTGSAASGASAGSVGKRRYDPEDERRHRQGALAAGGMLGGGALTVSGGREVVRDTKGVRRARTDLDPGHPPTARTGEWRTNGRLRKPTSQESLGELMAHDKDMKSYGARLDAYRKLRNPKGAVVTGRAAGKIGAGLALLGAGAQLHRQRREPRFD